LINLGRTTQESMSLQQISVPNQAKVSYLAFP